MAQDDQATSQTLERSRNELESAIENFEKYLKVIQSISAGRRSGSIFNTLTLASLYSNLAETLTRLELPEQAAEARLKARQLERPRPRAPVKNPLVSRSSIRAPIIRLDLDDHMILLKRE